MLQVIMTPTDIIFSIIAVRIFSSLIIVGISWAKRCFYFSL